MEVILRALGDSSRAAPCFCSFFSSPDRLSVYREPIGGGNDDDDERTKEGTPCARARVSHPRKSRVGPLKFIRGRARDEGGR